MTNVAHGSLTPPFFCGDPICRAFEERRSHLSITPVSTRHWE